MTRIPGGMIWIAAGLVAGAAWIGAPHLRGARASTATAQTKPQDSPGTGLQKSVEVMHPLRRKMARLVEIPAATIEAYAQVEVSARIAGYVAEVHVDLGDRVHTGDLLARLAVPELEKDLLEARAQLAAASAEHESARTAGTAAAEAFVAQARAQLDVSRSEGERCQSMLEFETADFLRRESLHQDGALPDDAFDTARRHHEDARQAAKVAQAEVAAAAAGVSNAQAASATATAQVEVLRSRVDLAAARVERLQTMLSFAQITAPFDGVVTRRMADPGTLVQAGGSNKGSVLFVLHQVDRMRLAVEFPESDLQWLAVGTLVRVQPFAFRETSIEAQVSRLASALQLSTRTMRAEIDLDNRDRRLSHGMAARVLFELDIRPDALTIPAAALLVEGPEKFVYVVKDSVVERRAIETGIDDGIRLEVSKGLSENDLVVVTGKSSVSEGMAVRAVVKEDSP